MNIRNRNYQQQKLSFLTNKGSGKNKIILGILLGLLLFGSGFALAKYSCCSAKEKEESKADKALDEFVHVIEYKGGGNRY